MRASWLRLLVVTERVIARVRSWPVSAPCCHEQRLKRKSDTTKGRGSSGRRLGSPSFRSASLLPLPFASCGPSHWMHGHGSARTDAKRSAGGPGPPAIAGECICDGGKGCKLAASLPADSATRRVACHHRATPSLRAFLGLPCGGSTIATMPPDILSFHANRGESSEGLSWTRLGRALAARRDRTLFPY